MKEQTKVRRLSMTAENILASLEGRKWKTRRVIQPQQLLMTKAKWTGEDWLFHRDGPTCHRMKCPYGAPGDPLALTEVWRPRGVKNGKALIEYRAGCSRLWQPMPENDHPKITRALKHGRWLPPMFMQAWASRAPAVNKEVRVERVQEITEEDAKAEGIERNILGWINYLAEDRLMQSCGEGARSSFRTLWDSINDKRGFGWDTNPWVWVVEFKQIDLARVAVG